MRSVKVLLTLCLIPSLLAASDEPLSDSVRSLLRKPRGGEAQISLADGTSMGGYVARVTTESLLLQRSLICQSIALSEIRNFRWVDHGGYRFDDIVGGAVYLAVLSPFFLAFGVASLFRGHDGLQGQWRSVSSVPDDNATVLTFGDNFVTRANGLIKKGNYQINGNQLHLTYSSGAIETISFRIDCDKLLLHSQDDQALRWTNTWTNHVHPPIVGRWQRGFYNSEQTYWEFQPHGTFETGTMGSPLHGSFRRLKHALRITWHGSGTVSEDWGIRVEKGHLLITKDGTTSEYRRPDAVAW